MLLQEDSKTKERKAEMSSGISECRLYKKNLFMTDLYNEGWLSVLYGITVNFPILYTVTVQSLVFS